MRNLYNALTREIHHFEESCSGSQGRNKTYQFVRQKKPIAKAPDKNNNGIKLYPNPANTLVTIESNDITHIVISDIAGRIVYTGRYNNVDRVQLNISAYSKGVYLVKLIDKANRSQVQKLIIE